jgi:hypothetical protein
MQSGSTGRIRGTSFLFLCTVLMTFSAAAATLQVGPGKTYPTLSSLPALSPGDIVEIYSATYNEVKRWSNAGTAASPITIRGIGATRPIIDGNGFNIDGSLPRGRGVFQIEASYITVENIEFKNGRNSSNGAAVRVTTFGSTTTNVTLRNCKVSNCDMGIVGDSYDNLLIESCDVGFCGYSGRSGYTHNFYLGGEKSTIRYCYIHDSQHGENFKTRGHYTEMLYNYIADSQDGELCFVDDTITEATNSHAVMIGNVVVSKPRLSGFNSARFIQFGQDSGFAHRGTLYAFNNTFIAGDSRIWFLSANATGSSIVARNNIFFGSPNLGDGAIGGSSNWTPTGMSVPAGFAALSGSSPGFVNAGARDYHLTATSPCRNLGTASLTYLNGSGAGQSGTPTREYIHPLQSTARAADATLDAGAYENGGTAATPPSISTHPASRTVTAGQTAAFSVVASGTATLSYQWQKNGTNISGATAASYTTLATTTADNGATFRVIVSNTAGSVTSNSATLTVTAAPVAPTIATHPVSRTVTAGQTAAFSVVANGTAPLSYQWQKNGGNISGATAASYTTPATTAADNGATFRVIVSNSAGSATSNSATLTVTAPPAGTRFSFQNFEGSTVPINGDGDTYPMQYAGSGTGTVTLDATDAIVGNKCAKLAVTAGNAYPSWNAFNYGGGKTGVVSPRGFTREYAESPAGWQFNTYNRMVIWFKPPTSAGAAFPAGNNNCDLGTYVKRVTNPDGYSDEEGGNHYYHSFNVAPTGTWTKIIVNMHPNHQRGGDGNFDWGIMEHPTGETQYNYFDALTRIYFEFYNAPDSYPAAYKFDGLEFYKETRAENDQQVYMITATHVAASNRVRLTWNRHKDEETIRHQVRYSYQDIHTIGWNAATAAPNGIITPPQSGGYNGMVYDTTAIPTAGQTVLYLAIKPENATLFSQISIPLNGSTAIPPSITTHPANRAVAAGQTAAFSVVANGTAPLAYQWQKNGVNISGATALSYTTPATTLADNGTTFRVIVTNSAGTSISNSATLTVNSANRAPVISSPATATPNPLFVGQYTTFTVAASDPDGNALTYAWNFGDGTSGTGPSIQHAYTTAGSFAARVTISDGKGGSVSGQVTVTVNTSTAPYIVSFTLINADTDQPIAQHDPLLNGTTIDLGALPTQRLNVRANVSPATVGSVRFGYDAIANYRTENVTPYALGSDTNGNYGSWTPSTASHTLTATPFTGGSGSGTAGAPLTIRFNVVAASAVEAAADVLAESEEPTGGDGSGSGGGGTPQPEQIIDLGTLTLNARAKIVLPLPETMQQYRRMRGKASSVLPAKLRVTGSKLSGKATVLGVYEFTINWETRIKVSDEKGKRIERLNTEQRYRITVVE